MLQRVWWIAGGAGVLIGGLAQVLLGHSGVVIGVLALILNLAGVALWRFQQQRRYRLTREQAYRLHQKMLAYASDDGWRTPGNV